ncbi:MAG: penicillin acylase family protein [Bdellovibrionales bacterium]|nr:penicillin acylase family protein [Bdellovibrionales bacterium]
MVSNTLRAQWEDLSDRSFNDSLLDAFRESLELLVQRAGPLTSSWAWGSFHQIEWQHPVNFIPGLGPWLNKSLFGPPPSVSGAVDTPGHFDFNWDPAEPLEFSAKHAAAMRMCTTLSAQPGPSKTRWTAATGVSGNPLSKWAWTFAHDFYFRDQLTK